MAVLQSTLALIRDRLDQQLRNLEPRSEDWVVLSNIVDNDGRVEDATRNKLVMMLVNIEQDTTISTYNPTVPGKNNVYTVVSPPLYINLYVLFYANFTGRNYPQGLGVLSSTLSFFQQMPVFTHQNLPGLDPVIDRLAFEVNSTDLTGLNYLLGAAGVKSLPCVLYKARMIPFRSAMPVAEVPAAERMDPNG